LLAQGPRSLIQRSLVVIPQLYKRLEQEARRGLVSKRQSVAMQMAALDALSPLAILQRGFSIVHTVSDGRIVRRASDVAVGEAVQVTLGEGQLVCQVDKVVSESIS
jgi:exodeoxyribonuclease VII large subunit